MDHKIISLGTKCWKVSPQVYGMYVEQVVCSDSYPHVIKHFASNPVPADPYGLVRELLKACSKAGGEWLVYPWLEVLTEAEEMDEVAYYDSETLRQPSHQDVYRYYDK